MLESGDELAVVHGRLADEDAPVGAQLAERAAHALAFAALAKTTNEDLTVDRDDRFQYPSRRFCSQARRLSRCPE